MTLSPLSFIQQRLPRSGRLPDTTLQRGRATDAPQARLTEQEEDS